MARLCLKLSLPGKLVREPVMYQLAHDLGVIFSIEKGRFTGRNAWLVVHLEGKKKLLADAIEFLRAKGVAAEVVPAERMGGGQRGGS